MSSTHQIAGLIAGGCSLRDAAHFMHCSYDTIRREMKRDPAFKEQLGRSELYAQLSPLRSMQQAVSTHWRAAAWFLERAYPERFAPRPGHSRSPASPRALRPDPRHYPERSPRSTLLHSHREGACVPPFNALFATGQNARNSRDLREVLKFFEEKDGLAGLMPRFDFFDPLSKLRSRSAQDAADTGEASRGSRGRPVALRQRNPRSQSARSSRACQENARCRARRQGAE